MGKIKDEIQQLRETCERKYQEGGAAAVIEYIEEAIRHGQQMILLEVQYERCEACDADMPSIGHECLVCGQETKISKQQLVDAVIEDLKRGFEKGDYTVLDELLNKLPVKTLVQALPEEDWQVYDELNNSYFEIMHQDYYEPAGREEIQIHAGEHGNVYLFQDGDKLGFIIDVYGQNDQLDTMTVWEEDLKDWDEDEEPIDPNNFSLVEQEDFLDQWGQLTDEVCAELGYDEETSDDLLMVDYFYYEPKKYWIPKISSLYTPREQSIADYLRLG